MVGRRAAADPTALAPLVEKASGLLAASLAPATARQYKRGWSQFTSFAQLHHLCEMPAAPATVALYIAHLVSPPTLAAPATVASTISALAYMHKIRGFEDPASSFFLRKIMRGVTNSRPSSDRRIPITLALLEDLLQAIPRVLQSPFQQALYASLFATMFGAFLRISEVTASPHNVLLHQFALSAGSVDITFLSFKHHKGHPITISLPATHTATACPVKLITQYFLLRGNEPGPAFCLENGRALEPSLFRNTLTAVSRAAGLNSLHLTSHSFRIGAATFAASRGYSSQQIQAMGRWKSDAFKRYIRIPSISMPMQSN